MGHFPLSADNPMRHFCLCLILLVLLASPHVVAQQPTSELSVEELIQRLASPRFRVREDSTLALWERGESIRNRLVEKENHPDLEVRERVGYVLDMLNLGLTPSTPAPIRRHVQVLETGQGKAAQNAAKELFAAKRTETLSALIKNADAKNGDQARILGEVLNAMRTMRSNLPSPDFCFEQLDVIQQQPDEMTRDRLLGTLLSISQVSQALQSEKWVLAMTDMIANDKSTLVRRRLIGRIYASSTTVSILVKKDRLHEWIDAIAESQNKAQRGLYLRQIASSSTVKGFLSKDGALIKLIDKLSPAGRETLLVQLTTTRDLHEVLFQQYGDQKLRDLYDQLADRDAARKLQGRLLAMPFWYKKHQDQAVALVSKDYPDAEKKSLLVGLLEGWQQIGSTDRGSVDQEFVTEIWGQITANPTPWKLHPLLLSYGLPDLFKDRFGEKSIKQILEAPKGIGKEAEVLLAQAPTRYAKLAEQLNEQGKILEFMRAVKRSAPDTWRSYASNLYRSDRVAGALTKPDQRQALLDFVSEEKNDNTRYSHLMGLIDNRVLLPRLVKEDKKYDAIVKLFPDKAMSYQRAQLIGKILSKQEVVDFLVAQDRVDDLMVFNEKGQTANDKQLILTNLLNSDAAVKTIIESGRLEDLNQAIAKCDKRYAQRLHQKLMVRQAYLEIVIKEGNVSGLLEALANQPAHEQSQTAIKLAEQLEKQDLEREPRIALEFWKIATKPKASYYEQRLGQKLLTLKWFRAQVIEINKRDDGFTVLIQRTSSEHLQRVLSGMMSGSFMSDLLDQNQLPFLETLCVGLTPSHQRNLLVNAGHSSSLRAWITKENNLDVFCEKVKSLKNASLKISLAAHVLCSHSIVNNDNKDKISQYLIDLGTSQEPEDAARLCVYLLANSNLQQMALKSPMFDKLVEQLEPGVATPEFINEFAGQYSAMGALANKGHARKMVDAMLAVRHDDYRLNIYRNLLSFTILEKQLKDAEVRAIVDDLLASPKSRNQLYSLMGASCVSRLIQLGYFDRLYDFAKSQKTSSNSTPIIWQLMMNPAVVKKMRADGKTTEELTKVLDSGNQYRLRSCMQSLMNSDALTWFMDEHGWDGVKKYLGRLADRDRQQVYSSIINSAQIQEHCIAKQDLSILDEALAELSSAQHYRTSLVSMLVYRNGFREGKIGKEFLNQLAALINKETDPTRKKQMLDYVRNNSTVRAKVNAVGDSDLKAMLDAPDQ